MFNVCHKWVSGYYYLISYSKGDRRYGKMSAHVIKNRNIYLQGKYAKDAEDEVQIEPGRAQKCLLRP
jgi:hypothetical protein